jgi:hypothetical protein
VENLVLPRRPELRVASSDEELDPSEPRKRHHIDERLRSVGLGVDRP